MRTNQSKTVFGTWANDFVSMPGTSFWREPSLYLCLRQCEYARPLTNMIFNAIILVQLHMKSIRLQALHILFFLKQQPKVAAETYSIWHKSNTGRVYQKRILFLFTVLGLTVQVFLEMFNRTKVCEKNQKKKNLQAQLMWMLGVFFFFF